MDRMTFNFRDIKAAPDDSGGMRFSGYGAVFGNMDSWGDVVLPGAFEDTLKQAKETNQWPSMLLQHGMTSDMDVPVGIWTEIKEDPIGLFVEGKLAETDKGKDVYTLLKMEPRPAINGLSIGYIPIEWTNRTKPDEPRRTLKKVQLWEVSLVTFPANEKARVTSVKFDLTIRDAERALRDFGFDRERAKEILAEGFRNCSCDSADDALFDVIGQLHRNIDLLTGAVEIKPYPNEHACRLIEPIQGAPTRRVNGEQEHNGKKYDVIYQEQRDGNWRQQAYRYPKKIWTSKEARSHCKDHDGILFEPAG